MALGSAVCIVGAILQAAGQNLHMLMAGRVILGAGVAVVQAAGPSYVVEMSYPKYRGQLTGGFQACFFLGTIVSTFLEYGLSFAKDAGSLVWRLPLAVQGLPSVIVLLFVWLIPESPRWYVISSARIPKKKEKKRKRTITKMLPQVRRSRTDRQSPRYLDPVPRRRRSQLQGRRTRTRGDARGHQPGGLRQTLLGFPGAVQLARGAASHVSRHLHCLVRPAGSSADQLLLSADG